MNRGLNPYCSGQWSRTMKCLMSLCEIGLSLNPCCSGQWSRTAFETYVWLKKAVLILVVVEDGLVLLELQTLKPEVHKS